MADVPPGPRLEITQQIIDGEMVYLVWNGESDTLAFPFATDTLIVRDGQIVQQTFAAQMKAKSA